MKCFYKPITVLIITCLLAFDVANAQTFTDGPIQLQVRLRDVSVGFNETDASLFGVGFAPDEPVIKVWAQDNADLDGVGWQGGTCHNFSMGTGAAIGLPGITPAINEMLLNYTYPNANVPQFFDLRVDAWEDDNPSDGLGGFCNNGQVCNFDNSQCCGIVVFGACIGLTQGDDYRCNSNPFKTQMPYRNGPPCQWYNQGYVTGPCNADFKPGIETYWRYTNGTSCATALDLGTITTGATLTHFNSNECYSNSHTASPGNDVWYKFHANGPIGINASLCGVNGAQFDSYLYLYSSCGAPVADTANDDACGTQSALSYSICQAGDYYLVVDGKTAGDMGTFTLTVTDNPNFTFAVNPVVQDVSCFGGSNGQITAVTQGGTAPFTYSWSNTATTQTITGLSGGTYSVSVTDFRGCQASASAQVNVPTQLTATTTSTPVSCGGACDGSATVTAQGGTQPYTYAWNSLPPQQLANATYLCAANYVVTVSDSKSCTVTATTVVQNTTTIVITVDSVNDVQCNGLANGSVYLTTSGGQTPYIYNWSNSATNEDITNLSPGTYTLTITDNTGCSAGDSYIINEPAALTSTVSFTFNPRCNAGADGIINITVGGGVQPYSYNWSNTATSQNLNNVQAGAYNVTVSDAKNCTVTASATLTEPTPFAITLNTTNLQCFGNTDGTASVTVSGETAPYTYFWSNFSTTANATALDGGPFSVVIEDANGCDTIVTGTITSPAQIDVQLTPNEPLCADSGNGSISTTVTGGTTPYGYSWSGTGGFTSTQQNPQVTSGTFTLTVTDASNCTATGTTAVNSPQPFIVNVIAVNPNCQGDSTGAVVANTQGGVNPFNYGWSTSALDTVALLGLSSGNYAVTVTDVNGCVASGQATLVDPSVNPANCNPDNFVVLIPNAFTPNGDNVNDRLVAIVRNVQKLEMRVYNRWGEEMYYNSNMLPGDGWDGTFKGKQQPMGTYVYLFNVTYTNGVRASETKSVTLIR